MEGERQAGGGGGRGAAALLCALAFACGSAGSTRSAADAGPIGIVLGGPGGPEARHDGGVEVDAGVVTVQAPPTACPGITSLTIDPAEIQPNQSAQLGLVTIGPAPLITWSVTTLQPTPGPGGGTFSPSASVANPTFLPSRPGTQVQITATVALPDSRACASAPFTSLSALINVEAVSTTGGVEVDASVSAIDP